MSPPSNKVSLSDALFLAKKIISSIYKFVLTRDLKIQQKRFYSPGMISENSLKLGL